MRSLTVAIDIFLNTQREPPNMSHTLSRRSVLKSAAGVAAGLWVAPELRADVSSSPNEKLNIACIGIGGRGSANVQGVAHENLVALCDVDDMRAGKMFEKHPGARKFYDFRVMLDEMENQIDAVVVSTPDHTHFHAAMDAMQRGKHLYCEKPMAHSVWEIRTMTDFARKQGVATQLGCQRHALDVMHRSVEMIWSGAIGKVSEVHCWVGKDRGMPEIPTEFPPVPSHVRWDLWLGPAKERPYSPAYCPYGWRFWWDFGTGETGNWGCHILDIPFWALKLTHANRVEASGPPVHPETTPKSMTTMLRFEEQDVDLHWYHAKNGPPILHTLGLTEDEAKKMNTIFVGSEGTLATGFRSWKLLPEDRFDDYKLPDPMIVDSPGFHQEWIDACKGGVPATCNFEYSGPLAEAVLLANTAYRAEGGFDWDASTLTASGNAKVGQFLRPEFRKGWEVNY